MIDLFGNNGRKTFRAVFVWGMESHKATDIQTAELSTVDWTKYVKGNFVNLQRVKGKLNRAARRAYSLAYYHKNKKLKFIREAKSESA